MSKYPIDMCMITVLLVKSCTDYKVTVFNAGTRLLFSEAILIAFWCVLLSSSDFVMSNTKDLEKYRYLANVLTHKDEIVSTINWKKGT